MHRKSLPIGIQNLKEIRTGGFYYVDKTRFACRLVSEGKYFFLSRPRRFGKSLFLDTLKELFECHRTLFAGLYADTHWDWSTPGPVIRISFGSGVVRGREELDRRIRQQLIDIRRELSLPEPEAAAEDIVGTFTHLIRDAATQYGQRAVVLIDEYDKPILDNLSAPEAAIEAREGLKNLYSVLKDADPWLRFVFLTGVSKFSKVSLFSGLNNLNDITLDAEYSAICGYTDSDVDTVFAPELPELDRDEVRRWYNGYNWGGEPVYNPFDLLLLFQKRD
ncbi:MAG: AAA family ATPase, partial [Rhodocyclaceae bacterium]